MERCCKDAHVSVLSREILEWLRPESGKVYVDGTLGLGGHSLRILEASSPGGRVVGFEWDDQAAELARKRLEGFGGRLYLVRSSYAQLLEGLEQLGFTAIDGLLLDLGVSSLQLDNGERGFSFQVDAPLDMRMDRSRKETAARLVQRLSRDELADIFYNYGEERQARRIAAHLVEARGKKPVQTTRQLAELVGEAIPRKYHPKKRHVATQVFQALRIAVNGELDNLVRVLADAPSVVVPGGRICVITFHSLEDRIVKYAFTNNPAYRVVSGKPILPAEAEIAENPRARSAKLRVAERA
jgi:16S rRNA (cytosine1402-N4)-methyltransferase